ncbi:hypothetical protein NST18_12790 [Anoxybacillus sp. FSL W8-0104]|uniref:hypothetical protein n=1 Tax=Anoxybacillus sp. FSL W8-0104 TaxID=2954594 RepID=UPI000A76863A
MKTIAKGDGVVKIGSNLTYEARIQIQSNGFIYPTGMVVLHLQEIKLLGGLLNKEDKYD